MVTGHNFLLQHCQSNYSKQQNTKTLPLPARKMPPIPDSPPRIYTSRTRKRIPKQPLLLKPTHRETQPETVPQTP